MGIRGNERPALENSGTLTTRECGTPTTGTWGNLCRQVPFEDEGWLPLLSRALDEMGTPISSGPSILPKLEVGVTQKIFPIPIQGCLDRFAPAHSLVESGFLPLFLPILGLLWWLLADTGKARWDRGGAVGRTIVMVSWEKQKEILVLDLLSCS